MTRRRIAALLVILLCCAASAWALTQGPNNCGKGSSVGVPAWVNPNNIATGGGNSSNISITASGISGELQASIFGFAIPTGSTINGIQVSITRRASNSTVVTDNGVFLLKNGTDTGTDHSNAANWPIAFTAQAYGSVSDLWGASWAPADINSSGFGVGITAFNADTVSRAAYVQSFVTITITYSAPPAGLSFSPGIIGTITRQSGSVKIF